MNLLARLPKLQPFSQNLCLADIGQGINRLPHYLDGACPPLAQNSIIWSMPHGLMLNKYHHMKLMGHVLRHLDFSVVSTTSIKMMSGLALHSASVGTLMAALMGAIFADRRDVENKDTENKAD